MRFFLRGLWRAALLVAVLGATAHAYAATIAIIGTGNAFEFYFRRPAAN